MLKVLKKIFQYPRLTQGYPQIKPDASLFLGAPEIDLQKCTGCRECVSRCPASAIVTGREADDIGFNYDECIFCLLCEEVCPVGAVTVTNRFELAEKDRNKLRKNPLIVAENQVTGQDEEGLGRMVQEKARQLFGRSLQIREVDSGSCNACDYEINALNNPFNDIERLGISFVASPRHADMLLVTGTAVRNMEEALLKTYQATPDPKLVVAVGACACSGGIFKDAYAARSGIDSLIPVDVYVPGCPPRPQAIIYGILKALERIK